MCQVDRDEASSLSDAYEIAVKVVEREIREPSSPEFVQSLLYVLENGDRHLFAEKNSLDAIGMPMHAREVAPPGFVRSELVQLTADGHLPDIRTGVIGKGQTIRRRHLGSEQRRDFRRFIEKCFQKGGARTGNRRVSRTVGWVQRTALREFLWQQIGAVLLEN